MEAREKAKELFDKFFDYAEAFSSRQQIDNAKKCVFILCDEFIEYADDTERPNLLKYWLEVKNEIEKC